MKVENGTLTILKDVYITVKSGLSDGTWVYLPKGLTHSSPYTVALVQTDTSNVTSDINIIMSRVLQLNTSAITSANLTTYIRELKLNIDFVNGTYNFTDLTESSQIQKTLMNVYYKD